jgi:hypothetical protein
MNTTIKYVGFRSHSGDTENASIIGCDTVDWPVSSGVPKDCTAFRTAIFWVITQGVVVIITDVSGQPIGPIFRDQETETLDIKFYNFLFRPQT